MKFIFGSCALCVFLFLFGSVSWAASCKELDSPEKTRAFLAQTKESNPLWRKSLSVYLEVSPCEGRACSRSQRKKRLALLQNIHLLRSGNKRRANVIKGPNASQCILSRGSRDYLCAQCDATTNIDCRSIVRGSSSGKIAGTNIDLNDFDALTSPRFTSTCSEIEKKPNLLKIVSTRKEGEFPYEKIISVFDKKRDLPVTINFFAEGVLRKVYRFFPKYYVKFGKQWVATIIRVRSTQGSEKKFLFETQLRVLKGKNGKFLLFLDPATDPNLKGFEINSLFFTN